MAADKLGSLGRIMTWGLLLGHLGHDEWALSHEGMEWVEGSRCVVLTFTRTPPGGGASNGPTLSKRFWVDLEHGGIARKREWTVDGLLTNRMSNVVVESFRDRAGNAVWLPVAGTFDAFDESGNVVNHETYAVLRSSIRINTGLRDPEFSVQYRQETLITDQLKRDRYEFGRVRLAPRKRLTREEAEALLNEQLRRAEAQGDELKAPSWERSGPDWTSWAP